MTEEISHLWNQQMAKQAHDKTTAWHGINSK